MSHLGYYSPAILGALAVVIYAVFGRGDWSSTDRALIAAAGAPSAALTCQLLMLAAQGVFAGVLPVPFRRTMRGKKCVGVGLLVFLGMALGAMAWLAARTGTGRLTLAFAVAGAGCWLLALGIYGWSVPTATEDFAEPSTG